MKVDFKTLLIGLLLGICVTLSMGQRAAEPKQKLDADYRYQISATSFVDNGSNVHILYILDHETNRIYACQGFYPGGAGQEVKKLIGANGR